MGTATRPAKTVPAPWDAFSDVAAFVDEVLVELAAMAADGTRPTRPGMAFVQNKLLGAGWIDTASVSLTTAVIVSPTFSMGRAACREGSVTSTV